MTPEEKLMAARCRLITVQPFYGHMGMQLHWQKSDFSWIPPGQVKTMGVTARSGHLECLWYLDFVKSRTVPQLFAAIQHEIEHLVRMHLARYSSKYSQLLWNLAIDMCVNGRQSNPRIGCLEGDQLVLPVTAKEGNMSWIPPDWPEDETAEYFYDKIKTDERFAWARKLAAQQMFYEGMIDDHSLWKNSEMSPDEIRQLIHDTTVQAVQRSQGKIPGHLAELLKELAKPIVSWRQILRQFFGRHLGDRRKTYSRRDRRRDIFGLPGLSHHAAARASCIVDTSGSITTEDLEQFFAEIEAIAYRTRLCLLQWDTAFQGFIGRYRRGQWKKVKIKGRGGTDMAAPVEWLEQNGLVGDVCVMLTDGYCNYTQKKPFPMVTCITTPNGSEPTWGRVIRMNGTAIQSEEELCVG